MRACKTCGADKPLSEFPRSPTCRDGVRPECKECAAIKHRAFYEAHKEQQLAESRAWAKANPEKRKEIWQRYLHVNRGRHTESNRKYALLHHDRKLESQRKYRAAHVEQIRAKNRRWKQNNIEKRRLSGRACMATQRARQSLDTNVKPIPPEKILQRFEMFRNKCYICRIPVEHMDHVKPLKAGGLHLPANIRPICKACNSKKHAKWIHGDVRASLQMIMGKDAG